MGKVKTVKIGFGPIKTARKLADADAAHAVPTDTNLPNCPFSFLDRDKQNY
ncbi:ABC family transporter [Corchorus olitorius]|uniref:ABC family transporter n=1 Tax=Corchorus olitorius TaxID=93759 RepID=A0A1R3HNL4_9ROSI|nr:ABC family transporter [Corchorus olitorius]